ncbi:helix-turn-helix domain-containing protein [Brenneria populi subsp. brevivirga]|uniref:helix-turn-helix domain-containing protein n=1 Tax=Brenneria populi TaxID=1505588 RepID=UPI002E186894|nr:helix-turn-helix domain-containing protein [Brenneria populi subsp. brevivirga]
MQRDIIYDLVEWIESRLATKLSLDTVAAKSGYSKWHLQRLYHELTGVTLNRYIRLRKLSAAAVELQITRTQILDIALKYGFTSQQAFTRSFKEYFHQTPARYRKKSEWDYSQLYPPFQRTTYPVSTPDIISLPQQIFTGVPHNFSCVFENINQFDMEVRMNFFRRHFRDYPVLPSYAYGIRSFVPAGPKAPGLIMEYITASDYVRKYIERHRLRSVVIPEGSYAQFNYTGTKEGFQQFIMDVNRYHLPGLDITRRKGQDIERYYFADRNKHSLQSNFIQCSYLVPCSDSLLNPTASRLM